MIYKYKGRLVLFFLIVVSITKLVAQEKSVKDYFYAAGESFVINMSAYGFQNCISKNPVPLTFSQIEKNMNYKWNFDNSSFFRNQVMHPYLGGLFFNSGRANNLNFYESFGINLTNSFIWEFFLGNNAINDLIVTSYAGSITGEVLHRLCYSVNKVVPYAGFLLSPVDGINNLFRKNQLIIPNGNVTYTDLWIGGGIDTKTSNPLLSAGVLIVYGDPFGHTSKEPFDQFQVRGEFHSDFDNWFGYFKMNGNLYSWEIFPSELLYSTFGISMNYKAALASDYNFSTSDLGILFKQTVPLSDSLDFFYDTEIAFLILEGNQVKKISSYDYGISGILNMGVCYKNLSCLIEENVDFCILSKKIINMTRAEIEYSFTNNFAVGISDLFVLNKEQNIYNYISLSVKYKNSN